MFAIEVSFTDGVSQPEMILVRRPQVMLGASDYAHVVLEDMQTLGYQLHVHREVGRRFRCQPIGAAEGVQVPAILEGVYEGEASIDLGPLRLVITALDMDLVLKDGEPPDRVGVRVLRQVCSTPPPMFPAVVVPGKDPMVVSFAPDQTIYIGRSNQCEVRLDSSDISAKHARIGFESGHFWVEDLGSTNGTFVNQQQISGRVTLEVGDAVILGREIAIVGVTSEDQIQQLASAPASAPPRAPVAEQKYPVLLSVSEVARPARVVLQPGMSISIGRDPGSDMWLGAPHISRRHLVAVMNKAGSLVVHDQSTNGTLWDGGRLRKGDELEGNEQPLVFNFGGGVTVALCYNDVEEQAFQGSGGAPNTFTSTAGTQVMDQLMDVGTQAFGMEEHLSVDLINGTGTFAQAGEMYRSLKFSRKLLLVLVVMVGVLVIMVVANLMAGLL